ncbi:hypothetical protein [Clavibacter michiganensis]|uniref:hypothetical protein n=1 Tax=Clavibacter michiganensis TaxID=28447 RepID=UPI00292D5A40|nr:hypothetical protein [Clavibacter michiganensis]
MSDNDFRARIARNLILLEDIAEHAPKAIPINLVNSGSVLTLDDEALAPYQLSPVVSNCLTTARDVLATTRVVLDDDGAIRVPLVGLYPLLRSALESSALCIWLLSPDEPAIRYARAISVRWTDIVHDHNINEDVIAAYEEHDAEARSHKASAVRQNAKQTERKKTQLKRVAARLGIQIVKRPGFGPIVGDAGSVVELHEGNLRGAYGILSGLTHPSLSGTMRMSNVTRGESNGNGRLVVNMSANLQTVAFAIDAALVMYMEATSLLEKRVAITGIRWPTEETGKRLLAHRQGG